MLISIFTPTKPFQEEAGFAVSLLDWLEELATVALRKVGVIVSLAFLPDPRKSPGGFLSQNPVHPQAHLVRLNASTRENRQFPERVIQTERLRQ